MKISEFRQVRFTPKSQPSINTIKKWVDNGSIAGEIIGGCYYVSSDKIQPVNDLVNKVLK
jgi:S-methylmethionine-dependent homocysteine/selenocysteine methylase